MGKCHSCHRSIEKEDSDKSKDNELGKQSEKPEEDNDANEQELRRSSDSALDSSHSDEEDPTDKGKILKSNTRKPSIVLSRIESSTRESHSSESSGKYSMRDSIGSSTTSDKNARDKTSEATKTGHSDIPTTPESLTAADDDVFQYPNTSTSYQPIDMTKKTKLRNIIWHSAESADPYTRSSMTNVTAAIRARFQRSLSLKESNLPPEHIINELNEKSKKRAIRTVSLRLPRDRRDKDFDTKLPTIYVDDKSQSYRGERRSSLNIALSLLSLNTTGRRSSLTTEKPQKPVQKILRQPTRRHQTVRGMSGLAIDGSRQSSYAQHPGTLYYPTVVSMRQTTDRRQYLHSQ